MQYAISQLGHAGQPGYVIQRGDGVTVHKATNIPTGGYFIENAKTGQSILVGENELSEFVSDNPPPSLFARRGFGAKLFEPVFIGTTWTLEAERSLTGKIQAYATHATSARTYDYDPASGNVAPAGLPSYVKRRLAKLVRENQ